MDRNWQPGDRAVIDCPIESRHHGEECTILRTGVFVECIEGNYVGCEVDIPCISNSDYEFCIFENHELKPIYDGNETVSWESCIWKPKKDTVSDGFMIKVQAE